jgi:hypothetical protein
VILKEEELAKLRELGINEVVTATTTLQQLFEDFPDEDADEQTSEKVPSLKQHQHTLHGALKQLKHALQLLGAYVTIPERPTSLQVDIPESSGQGDDEAQPVFSPSKSFSEIREVGFKVSVYIPSYFLRFYLMKIQRR